MAGKRLTTERGRLWEAYLPLVWWIAGELAKKHRMDRQELIEEGEGAFALLICERWKEYDARKGAEITWIYWKVSSHLRDYIRKRKKRATQPLEQEEAEGEEVVRSEPPAKQHWIEVLWSELEDEGRKLLRVVFEAPGALSEELWELRPMRCDLPGQWKVAKRERDLCWRTRKSDPKRRRAVLGYLLKQGWDVRKIERAFNQVEECLCAPPKPPKPQLVGGGRGQ